MYSWTIKNYLPSALAAILTFMAYVDLKLIRARLTSRLEDSELIAYNLSFDVHEMPLPFGFMSSTKVTMWQSDAPKKRSFVTNSTHIIHPYTVALAIVE